MSKTLAELRAAKPQGRPERSMKTCLAPNLVAEIQSLTEELASLAPEANPETPAPPKRVGEGQPPRAREIRERLAELLDEMAEHEGELHVRATPTEGEWYQWTNEHPARKEGEPGHDRDQQITAGYCNAEDLIADLGRYAHKWNGEELADGDWAATFVGSVPPPDLKQMASLVVGMYENVVPLASWRAGLSANLKTLNDSDSPAPTDARPASSSDESPQSDTSTTTPTTD